MANIGKIACHFPQVPEGHNPNYDVREIRFLPRGTAPSSVSSIDDTQRIVAVYYIPPGETEITLANLPNYLVWQLVTD